MTPSRRPQSSVWGAILAVAVLPAAGFADDEPAIDYRAAISAAQHQNDVRLCPARISLKMSVICPGVKETKQVTYALKDGGVASLVISPRVDFSAVSIVDRSRVLHVLKAEDGSVAQSISFDGDKWVRWTAKLNQATITAANERPPQSVPDPRQVALSYANWSVAEALAAADSVVPPTAGGRLVSVRAKHPKGLTVEFQCSPESGFLPVRTTLFYPNGDINSRTQLEYQRVESRNCWVLKRATTSFWLPGSSENPPHAIHEIHVYSVDLLDPAEANRLLKADLPNGTRIADARNRRVD